MRINSQSQQTDIKSYEQCVRLCTEYVSQKDRFVNTWILLKTVSSTYNRCFVAGPGGGEGSYNPGQFLNVALECGDFVSRPNKVQAEEEEERALPVTRGRTEAEMIHFLFRFRFRHFQKENATPLIALFREAQ